MIILKIYDKNLRLFKNLGLKLPFKKSMLTQNWGKCKSEHKIYILMSRKLC